MDTQIVRLTKAARRVSTPLIHIKTPDQAATIKTLSEALVNGKVPALLTWDCIRGVNWINEPGMSVCWQVLLKKGRTTPRADELAGAQRDLAEQTSILPAALEAAQGFPEDTVLFVQNAHLFWEDKHVLQAAWNLRDTFKKDFRTLVLLTGTGATLPPELRDALPLSEELPTLDELETIVKEQFEAAHMADDPELRTKAVDAICGLPAFSAEQVVAMSFVRRDGKITLDTDGLWQRKREQIEQTPGLSVWKGDESFATLGGLDNIKQFSLDLVNGQDPPRVIVFMDEISR